MSKVKSANSELQSNLQQKQDKGRWSSVLRFVLSVTENDVDELESNLQAAKEQIGLAAMQLDEKGSAPRQQGR